MSSLLTNEASMTALLTLKKISGDMLGIQKRISTGLRISSAEDNIAYWGLSNSMRSDRTQLSTVNDSLKIGQAKIGQAQAVVKAIREEINGIKGDAGTAISNAKSDSKLQKLQASVNAHLSNIQKAIANASLDGDNFLENDGNGAFEIVASFHRENGAFQVDKITLNKADLQLTGHLAPYSAAEPTTNYSTTPQLKDGKTEGATEAEARAKAAKSAHETWAKGRNEYLEKNGVKFTKPEPSSAKKTEHDAWVKEHDTFYNEASASMSSTITSQGKLKDLFDAKLNPFLKAAGSKFDSGLINKFAAVVDKVVESLDNVDATLAVAKTQVDSQMNFINLLTNNLDKSVGALVDADMDAESARLSAVQVQQQLAVQALSIANQSTQHILSLYRQ
ncbi:flagellin [Bartonella sp. TP]|uniref:flagellin N-terminal helical domain-containing protein n=1 Tax=Bartonella sp. TP TaxID=3057550 RepID=UPI0025AF8100|nr:flagellin [Bartonella sp. TP]WJW80244.1 flagellin [Bartonella sp. TP]